MAVKTIRSRGNLGSAQTTREPSPNIWYDCPWSQLVAGEVAGSYIWDDFTSFNKTPATTEGNWSGERGYAQFSSTGGTITNDSTTTQGGELKILSDDDNEGVAIRTLSTPFKIIRTAEKFWFECRVKLSTIANTTFEFFVGLLEDIALTAAIPITTTAATLADYNLCGFYRTESAGSTMDTTYKANGVTAVTVGSAEITLVAATYVKLGMVFDPGTDPLKHDVANTGSAKYMLSFYKDNLRLTTTKQIPTAAGTDFPNDVSLGLVIAVRNAAGTSPGNATIDWWRAAQLL